MAEGGWRVARKAAGRGASAGAGAGAEGKGQKQRKVEVMAKRPHAGRTGKSAQRRGPKKERKQERITTGQ